MLRSFQCGQTQGNSFCELADVNNNSRLFQAILDHGVYGSKEMYGRIGDMPATVTPAGGFVDIGSGVAVPKPLTITLYGACPWAISLGADCNRPVPGLPNQHTGRVIGIQSIVITGQVDGIPSSGAGRAVPGTGGLRGPAVDGTQGSSLPARSVRRGRWPWMGPSGEAG